MLVGIFHHLDHNIDLFISWCRGQHCLCLRIIIMGQMVSTTEPEKWFSDLAIQIMCIKDQSQVL